MKMSVLDHSLMIQIIAGHNITQQKCLFSSDAKELLVPCGLSIHVFDVQTGSLRLMIEAPSVAEDDQMTVDQIFYIALDPIEPSTRVAAFTIKGIMYILDFKRGQCVMTCCLKPSKQQPGFRIMFAGIFSRHGSGDCRIYFCNDRHAVFVREVTIVDEMKAPSPKKRKNQENTTSRLNIMADYRKGEVRAAFGSRGEFLAIIRGKNLYGCNLLSGTRSYLHMSDIKFTSIASHPSEIVVATGNALGQIVIWRGFTESQNPCKSVYHWHPTPVCDMQFSSSGMQLYSVGTEAVLVCWDLMTGNKRFLPRLGQPIRYITCDRKHKLLAASQVDNTIQVFKSDISKYESWHQEMHEMVRDTSVPDVCCLQYHPQTDSFVTHGRPGHLQFYSVNQMKRVLDLDVVQRNFVPAEREKVITDVKVGLFALSSCGEWLVTYETRDDGINYPEDRIKFWAISSDNKFSQENVVDFPHEKALTNIKFSPDSRLLITCSHDATFKIWQLMADTKSGRTTWMSNRSGSRNPFWIPTLVSFSSDSSLMTVLFQSTLTFWTLSGDHFRHQEIVLSEEEIDTATVIGFQFGSGHLSHLFLEVRGSTIRVWNISTLNGRLITLIIRKILIRMPFLVFWKFEYLENFTIMSYESTENILACFTSNNRLLMFDVKQETPILSTAIPSQVTIKSSLFIPIEGQQRLVMLTGDQQLLALLPEAGVIKSPEKMTSEESSQDQMIVGKRIGMTGYIDPHLDTKKLITESFDCDKVADKMFIKVSSHVMPPIQKLTSVFLKCLLTGIPPKGGQETGD